MVSLLERHQYDNVQPVDNCVVTGVPVAEILPTSSIALTEKV